MKTSDKQILRNGEEKLMCLQEDSLANRSVSQVYERERMMTVISGRKCYELYGKSIQLGSLVKMLLESPRWYSPVRSLKWEVKALFSERIQEEFADKNMSLKQFAKTLKRKDIPSRRLLFRLVPLERHIEETECGLFPEEKKKWDYLIPTPMATNVTHLKRVKELMNKGVTFHSRLNGEKRPNSIIDYLIFNNLIDTPISSIWKGTVGQEKLKRKDGKTRTRDMKNLPAIMGISGMGFQLSPLYVQEMMGFPSMWIVSPFLLTNGEKNP